MSISRIIAGCLLSVGTSLSAVELMNDIDFSGGYRQDDFKTAYHYFLRDDARDVTNNITKAEHANIWQIGLKGRLVMPDLYCLQSFEFLRYFYLTGHAYWGRDAGHTHFEDNYESADNGFGCGTIKDYHTTDWQIGLGYLFDIGCFFGCNSDLDLSLGVLGGYSWDQQKITLGKRSVDSGFNGIAYLPDTSYNSANLFNRWQGGWLGTEIYYSHCNLLLNLGYEYHWSTWDSGENFPKVNFWDRRHSDNASGNVVYLDATYNVCDSWEVGIGLKWSRYTACKGKTKASDSDLYGYSDANGRLQSWQLTANLGYNF